MRAPILGILDAQEHVHDIGKVLEVTAELEHLSDRALHNDGHFHVDRATSCPGSAQPTKHGWHRSPRDYGRGRYTLPPLPSSPHGSPSGKCSAEFAGAPS